MNIMKSGRKEKEGFLRRYLVKRNGKKHLMGVVQEGVSEMMEEGWTRRICSEDRLVCKCKKGGGRVYFFMVLLEGRGWSYNIRMVTSDLVFYFS